MSTTSDPPAPTSTSTSNPPSALTSPSTTLTASAAHTILTAATTTATHLHCAQNIAVTDPAGFLLAFTRMDGAFLGSVDIAIRKARTVALFGGALATGDMYAQAQPGGPLYGIEGSNGGLVVFGGGVPCWVGGVFVGAVGVSGGTVGEDVECAVAGVESVGGKVVRGQGGT